LTAGVVIVAGAAEPDTLVQWTRPETARNPRWDFELMLRVYGSKEEFLVQRALAVPADRAPRALRGA
jgi:hypothetical protein